ncbi:MAG: DUF169 domain-containing protein [Desulfosoma sp.]|uniref:DUF169 domain-containing protein n=1 Tax=Desulfosoma sp. TaxID=2603217 RepID=UPI00404B3D1F
MVDYAAMQSMIQEAIKPRSLPLAVRFLGEDENFPEKTRRPRAFLKKRVTVCQGITMARLYGWSVGLKKEDIICVPALLGWGMSGAANRDEEMKQLMQSVGFASCPTVAEAQLAEMHCVPEGAVHGILLTPLAKALHEPHTVAIYCNPAQAMRVVQALTYCGDADVEGAAPCASVTGSFGGKVECLHTLYAPYALDAPRLAIPGMGDRIFSMTQDDELVVAFPGRWLPRVAQGLKEAGKAIGARYPVTFYQDFEPEFPVPYKDTAARLGLFDDEWAS